MTRRLEGVPWLRLLQALWFMLTLVSVALSILGIPASYQQRSHPPHADVVSITHAGLSIGVYAGYMAALNLSFLLNLVLGGLIAYRRWNEPVGLVTSLFLILFAGGNPGIGQPIAETYPSLTVLTSLMADFMLVVFTAFLFMFPDGRIVPRRATVPLILWALLTVAVTLISPDTGPNSSNPFPTMVGLLGGIGAQIYRYRKVSGPVQRQQTKWILFAAALFLVMVVFSTLILTPLSILPQIGTPGTQYDLVSTTALTLSFLVIPIALTIAILRYRLWDIDVLINRALVYGSLTATLALLYIGGVIGLQALFRVITGQHSDLAIVIVTLAIAALFSPWRRRLQAFIDRRFYRHKYDASRTLAAFSERLRDDVNLDQLTVDLLTVIQETMQPARTSLWLRSADREG